MHAHILRPKLYIPRIKHEIIFLFLLLLFNWYETKMKSKSVKAVEI